MLDRSFTVQFSFTDLGVPADLAAVLTRQGIEAPFPIQTATLQIGRAHV